MLQLNAYLHFNGNCREAFTFYETVFNQKIIAIQTYGDSPAKTQVPPEAHDWIIHVAIPFPHGILMGSDSLPSQHEVFGGVSLSLNASDPKEGEALFHALSQNGKVIMPYAPTFFAQQFGMVQDPFGVRWMIHVQA